MPIQILHPRSGEPIRSEKDWLRLAGPRGGKAHWKEGHSAMALARAWCPAGGSPAVPAEIQALLDAHPDLRGTELTEVHPERRVRFDRLRGEPRNADLVMRGVRGAERVAVSVEAKAYEPFDRTVAAVRAAVKRKLATGKASGGLDRLDGLLAALLPEAAHAGADPLRYQLFAAVAGALAYAREEKAHRALLIVHELVRDPLSRAVRRNAADLDAFVTRLVGRDVALAPGSLVGPVHVAGAEWIPASIPLYIGKAQRVLAG